MSFVCERPVLWSRPFLSAEGVFRHRVGNISDIGAGLRLEVLSTVLHARTSTIISKSTASLHRVELFGAGMRYCLGTSRSFIRLPAILPGCSTLAKSSKDSVMRSSIAYPCSLCNI